MVHWSYDLQCKCEGDVGKAKFKGGGECKQAETKWKVDIGQIWYCTKEALKRVFFRNKLKSWLWQDYRLYERFLARCDCLLLQYSSTFGAGMKSWWTPRATWWGRVWRGCKSLASSLRGCAGAPRRCGDRARWSGSGLRTRRVYHSLEKRWSTPRFWGRRTENS